MLRYYKDSRESQPAKWTASVRVSVMGRRSVARE